MSSTSCSAENSKRQGMDVPQLIEMIEQKFADLIFDTSLLEALPDFVLLDSQSSEEKFGITISSQEKGSKEQNVSFNDQNPAYMYSVDSQPDGTFGQADLSDASLGDFFKRPIKIASYEWGVNNLVFEKFNPWELYFENPRIINRISNFSLLRTKLRIKILLMVMVFTTDAL